MENLLENYWTSKRKIILLCFSFIILVNNGGYAQPAKTVKLKKEFTEVDFLPNIQGYFTGEIPFSKFCSVLGLQTNVGYSVFSFKVRYASQEEEMQCYGARMSDAILAEIGASCLGQPVIFTEIKAVSKDGKLIHLDPLRLIPVKDEN